MAMKQILKKIRMYVKPKYLFKSRIRRCKCCGKIAPIIQFGVDDEMRRCLFCQANGRYEYISEAIDELGKLEGKIIFDPSSDIYDFQNLINEINKMKDIRKELYTFILL